MIAIYRVLLRSEVTQSALKGVSYKDSYFPWHALNYVKYIICILHFTLQPTDLPALHLI